MKKLLLFFTLVAASFYADAANAQICPYVSTTTQQYYITVGDTNPNTQVFNTLTGAYVADSDSTYTAWLADGCSPGYQPTAAALYTYIASVAAGGAIKPSKSAVTLTGTPTTLTTFATFTLVTPNNGSGSILQLMNARLFTSPPLGYTLKFVNVGGTSSYPFILEDSASNSLATLNPGATADVTLTDNTTTAGTWNVTINQTASTSSASGSNASLPNPSGPDLVAGKPYTHYNSWFVLPMSSGDCAVSGNGLVCTTVNGVTPGDILPLNYGTSLASAGGNLNVALSGLTNSLANPVTMTTEGTYYDGPSVAQGTSGTWLAVGQVSVSGNAVGNYVTCKLWDGTTLIASAGIQTAGSNYDSMPLSGMLATPAANIKISCEDSSANGGTINASTGAETKASTLTVIQIQ